MASSDVEIIVDAFQAADAEHVVDVVRTVFAEYGFTWETGGYCADIYDIRGRYLDSGGAFFVARAGKAIVGCSGVTMHDGHAELHRMYLLKAFRGRGIGRRLLVACVEEARRAKAPAMRIWSDVLLPDAHRLYLRSGFQRRGERVCDDPDNSREYGFWKEPL
ncbi:MAG: GNAT family N-acetyltransferase [Phycisphaerales bacterium]|nr:GNAT family N-acetyltransferase [Phycisphaerales bacterium]